MEQKTKTFDAVAESRRWKQQTGQRLAAMTPAEQIAYLNRHLQNFREERSKLQPLENASKQNG